MSEITDSDLITEGKVDFLLSEAKEQLTATVADAEALTKSGVYLLGGLITVITALVGVTGAQFNGAKSLSEQRWGVIVPLLLTIIYAAVDAAMIMWTALSSKELEHGGNTPNNLATQELFQLDTRLIKFSEALSYQGRIDKNHRRNEQIGITINRGIKLACATPLIYLVLLVAAYLIAFFVPPVERIPLGGGGAGGGTGGLAVDLV